MFWLHHVRIVYGLAQAFRQDRAVENCWRLGDFAPGEANAHIILLPMNHRETSTVSKEPCILPERVARLTGLANDTSWPTQTVAAPTGRAASLDTLPRRL